MRPTHIRAIMHRSMIWRRSNARSERRAARNNTAGFADATRARTNSQGTVSRSGDMRHQRHRWSLIEQRRTLRKLDRKTTRF
jgi:hypothetical protein